MFDLRELYQELILEHCKRPRHFCLLAGANCKVEGYNPCAVISSRSTWISTTNGCGYWLPGLRLCDFYRLRLHDDGERAGQNPRRGEALFERSITW